eukprot:1145125-Pelagomonas_calceolata.AAC.4
MSGLIKQLRNSALSKAPILSFLLKLSAVLNEISHTDDVPGLQIHTDATGWMDVPPKSGTRLPAFLSPTLTRLWSACHSAAALKGMVYSCVPP